MARDVAERCAALRLSFTTAVTIPIVLAVVFSSCSCADVPKGQRTETQFFASLHGEPYEAPVDRRQRVSSNFERLAVGLTEGDVTALLGEPDFVVPLNDPIFGCKGYAWPYYFRVSHPPLGNENDARVEIFLDCDGRVRWAVMTTASGRTEIGSRSK